VKILSHQLKIADYGRNTWIAGDLDESVTRADFLKAETYIHVAKQLSRGDIIAVLSPDGSWYAEFMVRANGMTGVLIGALASYDFAVTDVKEVALETPEGFEIKYAGPTAKWRVTRLSDKSILKQGLSSKLEAHAWLASPVLQAA